MLILTCKTQEVAGFCCDPGKPREQEVVYNPCCPGSMEHGSPECTAPCLRLGLRCWAGLPSQLCHFLSNKKEKENRQAETQSSQALGAPWNGGRE